MLIEQDMVLDEKAESLIKYLGLGTPFIVFIFGLFESGFDTLAFNIFSRLSCQKILNNRDSSE